ncbi:MotA/TolQ/ExbB proton channel family protein [Couchioplanes azureus]|uniref:ABC transporter permease n=1 Tax=Couchioplanes caeruleus TaxID=56438 RepID=UPI001670F1A4|nr:ABC transporter permease [Couchioplanes caeruleus]GGQ45063.1 transporter [Couchioplanes caeruleus subsp. azureus]
MKVRHFVRLKLRLTANGLRAQSWRVVVFVLGVVFAVFGAVLGYAAFSLPGLVEEQRAAEIALPLGGALLVLSWLFLPLLFFGVDESLDPARFALLPLRRPVLIRGLLVASLIGVPALGTFAATLGMVHTAARLGGPAAALTELAGVTAGLLLCSAISRAVTSAFATALRSRRARDLATLLLAALAALIGPLQLAALGGAQYADWDRVGAVADVVAWTPLGAPYSMGVDVAAGRAWAVPVKAVLVTASIGLLLWWWSATVERAMLGAADGARPRQRSASRRGPVAELLPRWLPATRFGALTAREVRYWWREMRRRASLITFLVVGVFLPVFVTVTSESRSAPTGTLAFVGALAAVTLANQFGFEGSAYAANVVAGVPGRVELASRAAGFSAYAGPSLLAITLVVGAVTGRPAEVPALLGMLVAAYGVGLAIVLPMSVRAAYALPDTTNPFAMSSGGGMVKGLLSLAALFGAALATAPLHLGSAMLGDAWLWLGLPVGVAYGAAAFVIGLRLAGPMLDRRMPELLATVSAAQ